MKVLTAEEQRYVAEKAHRQLHLQDAIESLVTLPLRDMHEETGVPVAILLIWCGIAAECVAQDLIEALT